MITLTTPEFINSVIGGTDTVAFERFVLKQIVYQSITKHVTAVVEVSSTSEATMKPITGSLTIDTAASTLSIEVPQLDFYRQVTLTGAQNSAVRQFAIDAQNDLEAGLITIGVVDGVQADGPN